MRCGARSPNIQFWSSEEGLDLEYDSDGDLKDHKEFLNGDPQFRSHSASGVGSMVGNTQEIMWRSSACRCSS